MKVALYKYTKRTGFNGVLDAFIRTILGSDYSHIELIFSDGMSASSSWQDGGVRVKNIPIDHERWDYFDISREYDEVAARKWFSEHLGKDYDYKGAIGIVIRFLKTSVDKWFCCSSIQSALKIPGDQRLSPEDLADLIFNFKK